MLISLTVGKLDAGMAILLTRDNRLIEFPSILLPPSIAPGSIVDITVARNPSLEARTSSSFAGLQSDILAAYGMRSPTAPTLRCRNATQTSIVLEWEELDLATASLRSLALFRNGAKAGVIPRVGKDGEPVRATKVSGLAVDTEYTFHLLLRTSAGTYASPKLAVRTQKMTDLTGITVTPGPLPPPLRASLQAAVERIGARVVEGVRIDTTHFVCTEGRGREWERAGEMNIPVVRPEWVEGCEREGRIVGVRAYYLGADPKLRAVGQGVGIARQPQTPVGVTPRLGGEGATSPGGLPDRSVGSTASLGDGAEGPPVTPWPPGVPGGPNARGGRPQDEESESASEEGEDGAGPTVPEKDGPRRGRESVSEESEGEKDRGTKDGSVSSEDEDHDERKKDAEGDIGESQDSYSEVAL